MNPSEVSAGRVEALHAGQKLAKFFETFLNEAGYHGPMAVAGGYLRDLALYRQPKDLDIFLDGGMVGGMDGAEKLAASISNRLIGASVGRCIPCYGSWAEDIVCVTSVVMPTLPSLRERLSASSWPKACPLPEHSIDLVILFRERLLKDGFTPRMVNDVYNQELFLKAVLARVDLRLNALGATPGFTTSSSHWDMDAYNSRLVVQSARDDGDRDRIVRRLTRLTSEKFLGWTSYCEQEDGKLSPLAIGDGDFRATP